MMIELKTRRRWIVSILAAVAEPTEPRVPARVAVKRQRTQDIAQKGFALRLKAATRPLAEVSG